MATGETRLQALDRAIELSRTRSKATSAGQLVKDAKKIEAYLADEAS